MKALRILMVLLALVAPAFCEERALLMIWDSASPKVASTHKALVEQIRALRNDGHLDSLKNFSRKVKVYDFGKPEHLRALANLKVARNQAPTLAVVTLDDNSIPREIQWKTHYDTNVQALKGMDEFLGLVVKNPDNSVVTMIYNHPLPPRTQLNGLAFLDSPEKVYAMGDLRFKFFGSLEKGTAADFDTWYQAFVQSKDLFTCLQCTPRWITLSPVGSEGRYTHLVLGFFELTQGFYGGCVVYRTPGVNGGHRAWTIHKMNSGDDLTLDQGSVYDIHFGDDAVDIVLHLDSPKSGDGWSAAHLNFNFEVPEKPEKG